MKHTKPFTVMTGLGRAYVENTQTRTVLMSYPMQEETDEPMPVGECQSGIAAAHELCETLNRKESI